MRKRAERQGCSHLWKDERNTQLVISPCLFHGLLKRSKWPQRDFSSAQSLQLKSDQRRVSQNTQHLAAQLDSWLLIRWEHLQSSTSHSVGTRQGARETSSSGVAPDVLGDLGRVCVGTPAPEIASGPAPPASPPTPSCGAGTIDWGKASFSRSSFKEGPGQSQCPTWQNRGAQGHVHTAYKTSGCGWGHLPGGGRPWWWFSWSSLSIEWVFVYTLKLQLVY